jgi:hypothetical protein
MRHLNQRNIKIVDELLSFCYRQGCSTMNIQIDTVETETIITLCTKIERIIPEELEYIRQSLNTPRYHEMEEYYWSLTGDDENNAELSLVGMMTDEAVVNYTAPVLEVILKRKS